MSIQTAKLYKEATAVQRVWNTTLDASDSTPKEPKGATRWTYDPVFGLRGFQYVRFDQSGGADANQVVSYRGLISINNITSGTTTSITTSGLTADILADGLLWCLDDAGAAGAAPEGEIARITSNTTTVVNIDSNDSFSASPAANDDFRVLLPWAVIDSASGDVAANVAGIALVAQDQYDYGWVQFAGLHPTVACVAAGTAVTAGRSLIVGTNLVLDGSTSAAELRVGFTPTGISSDTVLRTLPLYLSCGQGLRLGASA